MNPSEIDEKVKEAVNYSYKDVKRIINNKYDKVSCEGIMHRVDKGWSLSAAACVAGLFAIVSTGVGTAAAMPLFVGGLACYAVSLVKGYSWKKELDFVLDELAKRNEEGKVPLNKEEVKKFLSEVKENYEWNNLMGNKQSDNDSTIDANLIKKESIISKIENSVKKFKEGLKNQLDENPEKKSENKLKK